MARGAYPKKGRYVVGVFTDVDGFKRALEDLLGRRFDRAVISVLANHDLVSDHFGGVIPGAGELAERLDTPREDLDTKGAVEAAIRFIAEGVSILGVIGAAGAAFVLGGPVGVAVGTGAATESTLEGVLGRYIDTAHTERYEQSVRDGGIVCWVHAYSAVEAGAARDALAGHGGGEVHEIDAA